MNIERASGWSRAVVEIRGDKAKLSKADGVVQEETPNADSAQQYHV